jgi:hypothetical protein
MDGFFTDSELDSAGEYITARFGKLPSHSLAFAYSQQAFMLSNLLVQLLEYPEVEGLVKLSGMLGLEFPVLDRVGHIVIDGTSWRSLHTHNPSSWK